MPEDPSDEEKDKFVEDVFGSIRTNNSNRLVKEATDTEPEEGSSPRPNVPDLTGEESDAEFDAKLDAIEEQARRDKERERWARIPRADPAPCKTCGQPAPHRCRRCKVPLCPAHFWWGRYPLCPRCGGKFLVFAIIVVNLGAICGRLLFWVIMSNLGR